MITEISKIKKLGLFINFKWAGDLQGFKRYNLIYGLNGTGKTTLSKLFSVFEVADTATLDDCEYEFKAHDGNTFANNKPFPEKIRVFNQDFIDKNVKIIHDGTAEPIVILGEDSQETLNKIKANEKLLNGDPDNPDQIGLVRELQKIREEISRAEVAIGNQFTAIARTIGTTFGGDAVRNYTKKNSEPDFRKLTEKQVLSEEDFEKNTTIANQKQKDKIDELSSPFFFEEEQKFDAFEILDSSLTESKELMEKTVESITLERLREHTDISEWVENGLKIHEAHSSVNCEFCEQPLPKERIEKLGSYFNEADKKLKDNIDLVLKRLRFIYGSIERISIPDKARFFEYLGEELVTASTKFDTERTTILEEIQKVAEQLKDKKLNTWKSLNFKHSVQSAGILESLTSINGLIKKHNADTEDFESNRKEALEKIKNHHLSSIFDDVKALEEEVKSLNLKQEIVLNGDPVDNTILGITQIRALITSDRNSISSAHSGCEKLNEMILKLLGRDEVIFEPKEEDGKVSGYLIKRGDTIAKNISDGEQTAIAFAYFCIHLSDQNFSLKDGIVVLDDPVSSLDYGMLYRVCAHIESKLINSAQLFILTHNHEFFNQVKQWFFNNPQINNVKARGENEDKEERGRLLMLNSIYDVSSKCRTSEIVELDELLRDYESEYHYLFKKLAQFDIDNPPEEGLNIRAIYDYPNMCRKLLECFLSFRCPKRGSFYTRMYGLKSFDGITSEDISYVYGFVNSHSHLDTKNGLIQFDPTLTLSGRDSVLKTLNLIELADKEHYKAMKKATGVT